MKKMKDFLMKSRGMSFLFLFLLSSNVIFSACSSLKKEKADNTELKTDKKTTVLILGAAGQIGKMLTDDLLSQTNYNLVLYARNANIRLANPNQERIKIIDGDFNDEQPLSKAMEGVDIVYLNDMNDYGAIKNILAVMKKHSVKRIITASIMDIYGEAKGPFGDWNLRMVGKEHIKKHARNAALVEVPELDYTILRLTWLYNNKTNKKYMLTQKGENFKGAQVTREAVSQLITDIISDHSDRFIKKSIGVSEPNTDWDKPFFY